MEHRTRLANQYQSQYTVTYINWPHKHFCHTANILTLPRSWTYEESLSTKKQSYWTWNSVCQFITSILFDKPYKNGFPSCSADYRYLTSKPLLRRSNTYCWWNNTLIGQNKLFSTVRQSQSWDSWDCLCCQRWLNWLCNSEWTWTALAWFLTC